MAAFRNVHKRRDPRTGLKIRARGSKGELPLSIAQEVRRLTRMIPLADAMVRATEARDRQLKKTSDPNALSVMPEDGDIQPLGAVLIKGEIGISFISFWLFRLRRWFRNFWSAAQFTHPKAWLLVSRNRARPG